MELSHFTIKLDLPGREETDGAFRIARRHHFTVIVDAWRKRNIEVTSAKGFDDPLCDTAIAQADHAIEHGVYLTTNNVALFVNSLLIDRFFGSGLDAADNKLKSLDIVFRRRNPVRLDRSLCNQASGAGER